MRTHSHQNVKKWHNVYYLGYEDAKYLASNLNTGFKMTLSLIRGINSITSRKIKICERNDIADIICGLSMEGQKILKNFCPVIVTVCY